MLIRKEESKDYERIHDVVKNAFESAEHADGNEQSLVEALRKGTSYIPELSLVAEIDGKIAGHIMFTKAGYIPAERFGIKPPFEVPGENFMAYKLKKAAPDICGVLQYAKEFCIN